MTSVCILVLNTYLNTISKNPGTGKRRHSQLQQLKYSVSNNGKYYLCTSVSHSSVFYVKVQTNIWNQSSKYAEWLKLHLCHLPDSDSDLGNLTQEIKMFIIFDQTRCNFIQ